MQVFVKSLSGPTYSFEVEPTDTIFDLKKQIQLKTSIDAEQCNLILYGKQLLNDRTFSDYVIIFFFKKKKRKKNIKKKI